MSLSRRFRLDPTPRPGARLRAWGGALFAHGVVGLALLLVWPEAREAEESMKSVEVRLVEMETPPPEPPPPPPPPRLPPPPPVAPPQVVAPPPPVPMPLAPPPAPKPVMVATTAATASAMVVAPVVARSEPALVPTPVAVVEPPRPPAPAPEPLVEARFDADYLSNPKPSYPVASRRLGEEGVVRLRVQVGADGRALKVELKASSGFDRLDRSALDTVARWNFVPARRGAAAVVSWVVVPIVFSLS